MRVLNIIASSIPFGRQTIHCRQPFPSPLHSLFVVEEPSSTSHCTMGLNLSLHDPDSVCHLWSVYDRSVLTKNRPQKLLLRRHSSERRQTLPLGVWIAAFGSSYSAPRPNLQPTHHFALTQLLDPTTRPTLCMCSSARQANRVPSGPRMVDPNHCLFEPMLRPPSWVLTPVGESWLSTPPRTTCSPRGPVPPPRLQATRHPQRQKRVNTSPRCLASGPNSLAATYV